MKQVDANFQAKFTAGRRRGSKKVAMKATQTQQANETQQKPLRWKRRLLSFLYNSGADGNYSTEAMQREAGLSIIRPSTKQVAVADGNINEGKYQVKLPFERLSSNANKGDTFE